MKRHRPGSKWRVLAQTNALPVQVENVGTFDELCVDRWLHVEQMDTSEWWMQVGDLCLSISIGPDGRAKVVTEIERRPDALYTKP